MKFILFIFFLICHTQPFAQKLGCNTIERREGIPRNRMLRSYMDTTTIFCVADNFSKWEAGGTLSIKFLSGSKKLQDKVINYSQEWLPHVNIQFKFVEPHNEADIRISLAATGEHYTNLGPIANLIPADEETMSIDTTDLGDSEIAWRTVVLHLFGHVLGFTHEHTPPSTGIQWNRTAINHYYKKLGMTEAQIDDEIITYLTLPSSNTALTDPGSIMRYPIPPWQVSRNAVGWSRNLSSADKALAAATYPKRISRPENEVNSIKYSGFSYADNHSNKGISFLPRFTVNSPVPAHLVVSFTIFHANGTPIKDEDGNFCFENQIATIKRFFLLPEKAYSFNLVRKQTLQIFLPYKEIPLPPGDHKLQVQFHLWQTDESRQLKLLHQSELQPISIRKS